MWKWAYWIPQNLAWCCWFTPAWLTPRQRTPAGCSFMMGVFNRMEYGVKVIKEEFFVLESVLAALAMSIKHRWGLSFIIPIQTGYDPNECCFRLWVLSTHSFIQLGCLFCSVFMLLLALYPYSMLQESVGIFLVVIIFYLCFVQLSQLESFSAASFPKSWPHPKNLSHQLPVSSLR